MNEMVLYPDYFHYLQQTNKKNDHMQFQINQIHLIQIKKKTNVIIAINKLQPSNYRYLMIC